MEMTMNQLVELTGKTFRTVKKRLQGLQPVREDGRIAYYNTKDALDFLYPIVATELAKENLLKEKAQREKIEHEVGILKGSLVPIEEIAKTVEREYSFVRAQVRSIPSKMAKPLSMINDPNEIYRRIGEAVDECLAELVADQMYLNKTEELKAKADQAEQVAEQSDGNENEELP